MLCIKKKKKRAGLVFKSTVNSVGPRPHCPPHPHPFSTALLCFMHITLAFFCSPRSASATLFRVRLLLIFPNVICAEVKVLYVNKRRNKGRGEKKKVCLFYLREWKRVQVEQVCWAAVGLGGVCVCVWETARLNSTGQKDSNGSWEDFSWCAIWVINHESKDESCCCKKKKDDRRPQGLVLKHRHPF